jgi:SAM-dependent methyltransferase
MTGEAYARARARIAEKDWDGAEDAAAELLESNEQDAGALALMADVFRGRGDRRMCLGYLTLALKAEPGHAPRQQAFLDALSGVPFDRQNPEIEALLLSCLRTPGLFVDNAARTWSTLLMLRPDFSQLMSRACGPLSGLNRDPFGKPPAPQALLDPFFLEGAGRLTVCDAAFERFMTRLRSFLPGAEPFENFTALAAAVAQYAFNTDYVLDVTEEEQEKASALRAKAEAGRADARDLCLLAAYIPLGTLPDAARAAEILAAAGAGALARQQIGDYLAIRRAGEALPALTPVASGVSEKVRAQYEEFPYPRWRGLSPGALTRNAHDAALAKPGARALVAGCGTGQEALHIAAQYPETQILAVDLSRASLGYAAEQARALGIKNVSFAQADILRLREAGRAFDYIACGGVLHHLRDPLEGWRALSDILAPGGVMRICLYSKAARRSVTRAHGVIAKRGFPSTPEGMRAFRRQAQKLLPAKDLARLMHWNDFYNLSMFRDLLFHVQEHQFDIPGIKAALDTLGLEFTAMHPPHADRAAYVQAYPSDPEGKNLDNWHAFEQKHPDTFRFMYFFWCRKK